MSKQFLDKQGLIEVSQSFDNKYVNKSDIPTKLSQLEEDDTHKVVAQEEKENWNNKVDKKEGYGLSKNDYDDTEKEKLNSSINKISVTSIIRRNNVILECTDNTGNSMSVNLPMVNPNVAGFMSFQDKRKLDVIENGANKTTKLSQLTNDKTFKTEAEIQSMIEKANSLTKEVHDSLPAQGVDNVLYLVKDSQGKDNNVYLEYLWIDNKFELIGSTDVDLSQYVKKEELVQYAKQEDIKTKLSEMEDDKDHRTVTDAEKQKLSNIKEQIVLTEAEYNALSVEAKNDNTKIYFIKAE